MPPPKFKSLTMDEELYNKFQKIYQDNEEHWKRKGVTSFAGFMQQYLLEILDRIEKEPVPKNSATL